MWQRLHGERALGVDFAVKACEIQDRDQKNASAMPEHAAPTDSTLKSNIDFYYDFVRNIVFWRPLT
jgi:hypothetical protein